jgi:D-sedoheptulose 7-phosphate isomerase
MTSMREDLQRYWRDLASVAASMPFSSMARAAQMLLDCHRRGGTIFVVGNGGSAATASHFACDLAKGTQCLEVPAFRVVPLTDNVPLLTAWANDTSYERVFAEQLSPLVRNGDVVIIITASGNSPNVLAVAETARERGATTIAMTGRFGGKVRRLVDLIIRVPSDSIEQVEDAHLAVAHSLCVILRGAIRPSDTTTDTTFPDPAVAPALVDTAS